MSVSPGAPDTRPPRELTARALAAGVAIGAALAAGNVYTSLKAAFLDTGALTAVLCTFTFFAVFRRALGRALTAAETNIAQTTAASAALATGMIGLNGAIPALHLLGHDYSGWLLVAWGLGLGVLALGLASALRGKLVVQDRLPFPTGAATAEVIRTIHSEAGQAGAAVRRTVLVLATAAAAAIVTWLRDGPRAVLPQAFFVPVTLGGMAASTLMLGLSVSPLMAGTGVFMGTRAAASLMGGGLVAWGVLGPAVHRAGFVRAPEYGALAGWLIWPALGLLVSNTVVPLLLDWRTVVRTLRDLAWVGARSGGAAAGGALGAALPASAGLRGPATAPLAADATRPALSRAARPRLAVALVLLAAVALTVVVAGWRGFHLHPGTVALGLVAAVALASVCARTAGETDIAPVGAVGMLAQILFGGRGASVSILAGSIVNGQATQASVSMWSYKAGHDLGASPRAQLAAQLAGVVTGALVAVPVYRLLLRAYGLGSERLPAPVALTWRGTAEGVQGGLATLPTGALTAMAVGAAAGAVFALLERSARARRWLPSVAAFGVGMITPASLSAAALAGALAMAALRRARPAVTDGAAQAVGAGALAGESLTGVAVALLMSLR